MMGKDKLYNTLWRLGVRVRNAGKRIGVPWMFEHILEVLAKRYVPPPKEEVEIQLDAGIRFTMPPGFRPVRTYASGAYEEEVTRVFRKLVSRGMTMVDVGAFCGYYTVLASRLVGPEGHVHSFEPHPASFAYLVRNISINGCRNVIPTNVAVTAETGTGNLVLDDDADHHWLSTSAGDTGIVVRTVSLDDYFKLAGWPPIHMIKIDVEGSEISVLKGMLELNRRSRKLSVILEFDMKNLTRVGDTRESLVSTLRDLGFTRGYIIERGMRPFSVEDSFPPAGRTTYNLLLVKQ